MLVEVVGSLDEAACELLRSLSSWKGSKLTVDSKCDQARPFRKLASIAGD